MSFWSHEYSALIDVNVVAKASIAAILPLSAQVTIAIGGVISDRLLDLNAQLAAATEASVQFSTPGAVLSGLISTHAEMTALLGLPSLDFSVGASVYADLIASLNVSIGVIKILVDAMLDLNSIALDLVADIESKLSAGPIKIIAWEPPGTTGAEVSAEIGSAISMFPNPTYGVLMITESPAAWNGIKYMLSVGF
jgi:hypothetical protein